MEKIEQISANYERWLHAPTIVASSSEKKLHALEDFGFTDIHSSEVSIPESVEQTIADELEKMGGAPPQL